MKRRQLFACLISAALLGVSESLGMCVEKPAAPLTIEEILWREANRINSNLHRIGKTNPGLTLLPAGEWPEGLGTTITPHTLKHDDLRPTTRTAHQHVVPRAIRR